VRKKIKGCKRGVREMGKINSSRIQGYDTNCLNITKLETLETENILRNCEAGNH